MFRDLNVRITPGRRLFAWILLLLLLAGSAFVLPRFTASQGLRRAGDLILWACVSLLAIKAVSFFLLDPLLRNRRTAGPGFARDILMVLLYIGCGAFLVHSLLGVKLGALLGTGAIAAAVVGLSLQEVLATSSRGSAFNWIRPSKWATGWKSRATCGAAQAGKPSWARWWP